jgi:hypothetical protein
MKVAQSFREGRCWTNASGLAAIAVLLVLAALRAVAAGSTDGSAGEAATEDLARKTQNPVANLISVPFQNNFNFAAGDDSDKMIYLLNVQPVVPIPLNERWNLITRTIVPVIDQPELAPGVGSEFGLGDINPTAFLSPAKPSRFIWGAGPTMTLPTASSTELGSGRWSAGPAAVGLFMEGPWVAGVLVNHQWDFAGWSSHDVNQLLIQPFVNYNLARGWYLCSVPLATADFTTGSDNRWTVPVGGGGGKITRVGKVGLPINTQLQAFYNAETPQFAPEWQLRFQLQFLFPR